MAFSETISLSEKMIDQSINYKSPGTYVLDKTPSGPFTVSYVGRSDDDVAGRLKKHAVKGVYKYFKFEYAANARSAFERECSLYHYYPNLDNYIHPARPEGTRYLCPVAGCRALL